MHDPGPDHGSDAGGPTPPAMPVDVAHPTLPVDYDGHDHDDDPGCAQ